MADEFGRYSPITPEPILTLEELARRNKVRSDAEAERKRREQLLIQEAKRQAQSKAESDSGNEDLRRFAPLKRRDDDEDLRRPNRTVQETPKTVKVGDVEKPVDAALAEIPDQMAFEEFLHSSRFNDFGDRARRRARTEELIDEGKSPEEAAQIAQNEQEGRQKAFEAGRERAKAGSGKGASGFVYKESSDLATDLVYGGTGLMARVIGANQTADEFQAFVEGSHAETADWRNENSPYPRIQGAVSGAANSMAQMVPGIAASAVAGPGVGMGVMAAQFGGQEYNRAKYEGAEAGLAGSQLEQYALVQGGIEAAVMPIMSKIPGLAGIEGRVLRQSIARGVAQHPTIRKAIASGVKTIGKDTAAEVTEEVITEVLHGLGDETMLSRDVDYKAIIADTVLQTVVMMGMTEGVQRASGAIRDRMTPDPTAPAAGTVPSTPTVDPATTAAEPVPVDNVTPEMMNHPAVREFMNKPQSARTYEAAVKAGMDPIPNPNREGRARYADDLRRRFADPVSRPAAPLEPSAVDRQIIETPSGTVSDGNIVPIGGSSREKIIQSPQEQQVQQEGYEGAPINEGRQEELLTSAASQNVTTPADSQIPPADHTRESFEKEYTENFLQMMELPPDDPGYQALESRMADLYDAHPDWAQNLETTQPLPSVVGQTEAGPDQSSPPATGSVSSPAEEPPQPERTQEERDSILEDIKRYDDDIAKYDEQIRKFPKDKSIQQARETIVEVRDWTRKQAPDVAAEYDKGRNQTSPVSAPEPDAIQYHSGLSRSPADISADAMPKKISQRKRPANAANDATPEKGNEPRQGVVGDKLATGEIVKTSSGRLTTPFPRFSTDTPQKASNTLKKVEAWLQSNALAEAESRGDDFNATQFRNETPGKIPPASKDAMEEYLFGEQPKVVPSILKPLVPKAETPTDSPVPAFAALPQKSQDLFNKAFESKNVEQLKQMVEKSNVAWNKEFERRTGVKLPRTLKDRYRAVMEWANPTPTYGKRSEIPKWGIYQTLFQGKPKFSVKESDNDKGLGDTLHDSAEEAQKYADNGRQREAERAEADARRKSAEEEAQKKQQEHEASFQGFLTDDPMVKGRRLKTLDASLNYKGKATTRKALVEQKVADGWTVNDKDQLQAQTGEFLDERDLTKTGIDYARNLINKSSESERAIPTDSQPEPTKRTATPDDADPFVVTKELTDKEIAKDGKGGVKPERKIVVVDKQGRTLAITKSKRFGDWSVSEREGRVDKWWASGIPTLEKAKDIARRVYRDQFTQDADLVYGKRPAKNLGMTNSEFGKDIANQKNSEKLAGTLIRYGLASNEAVMVRVSEKDKAAILKGIGEDVIPSVVGYPAANDMMEEMQRSLPNLPDAEILGFRGGDYQDATVAIRDAKSKDITVFGQKYVDTARKKFPNAKLKMAEDKLILAEGDTVVGMVVARLEPGDYHHDMLKKQGDAYPWKFDRELEAQQAIQTSQDEPSPPADSQPELNEVEQATLDELMGILAPNQTPVKPEKKPRAPRASAGSQPAAKKKPRSKVGEKIAKAKAASDADVKASYAKFLEDMRDQKIIALFPGAPPVMNPKAIASAVRLTADLAKNGVLTFADFATLTVENIGAELATKLAPYLETAWTMLKRVPGYENVDPAGNISDYIKETSNGNNQPERDESAGDGGSEAAGRPLGSERMEETSAEVVPTNDGGGDAGSSSTPSGGRSESEASGAAEVGNEGSGSVPSGPAGNDRPARRPGRLDYRITSEDRIGEKFNPRERFDKNVEAIKVLKLVESENRKATPEEQKVLAQYVGWGGLKEAFSTRDDQGLREKAILKDLLTEKELASARTSVRNAHYTSPEVISAMWSGLIDAGFSGGRVLEPSMGIGHFYGLVPESIADVSQLSGIEMDSLTARIAQQLYQTADVQHAMYQNVNVKNQQDLVISNVPFGQYKIKDKHDKSLKRLESVHNFFFLKALKNVRPGGVVAFITSRYTMDSVDPAIRDQITAAGGRFVGAVRLPNNAFMGIAKTKVTTDVIFIQKDAGDAQPWRNTRENADGFVFNEYFMDHPENVLGKIDPKGGTQINEWGIAPDGHDIGTELAKKIAAMPFDRSAMAENSTEDSQAVDDVSEDSDVPDGRLAIRNNKLFKAVGGKLEEVPLWGGERGQERKFAIIREMGKLAAVRDRLSDLETSPLATDAEIERARKLLNREYDRFVEEHGFVHKPENQGLFRPDEQLPTLLALEEWDTDTKTAKKADVFEKRVQQPDGSASTPTTAEGAAVESYARLGRIDLPLMAEWLGKSEAQVEADLTGWAYKDPGTGEWSLKNVYLSGNIAKKLKEAEAAAKNDPAYEKNVEDLKRVLPPRKTAGQIHVRARSPFVRAEQYVQFMQHLGVNGVVRHDDITGAWLIDNPHVSDPVKAGTWGVGEKSAADLLHGLLNNKPPVVWGRDPDGNRIVNEAATQLARAKAKEIEDEFGKWIFSDPDRAKQIEDSFNDTVGAFIEGEWDGSHLTLPGMNINITLLPHQKNAIWRAIVTGNLLLAHEVGLGKTFIMAAIAMERRRLGLATNQMFVVPNHLLSQWASEFKALYPSAKLLALESDQINSKNRRTLMERVKSGRFDAIIVTPEAYKKMPMSNDIVEAKLKEITERIENTIKEAKKAKGDNKNFVAKLESVLESIRGKMEAMLNDPAKDAGAKFDELGIDSIYVDEAHEYRNLWSMTQMGDISGVGLEGNQKTFDMLLKTDYLNQKTNGRGIVFATGTPIANSISELYSMQRYLQPQTLAEAGVASFDDWANTFGEAVTDIEVDPTGSGFRSKTRFKEFRNTIALSKIFRQVADVKYADDPDVGLDKVRPKLREGKLQTVQIMPSLGLLGYVRNLVRRLEISKKRSFDKRIDNPLKVTTDGRKAALDMRLVVPEEDSISSKINHAVENVARIYREEGERKGAQLMWVNLGTPASVKKKKSPAATPDPDADPTAAKMDSDEANLESGRINAYEDIKRKLIAQGIPENEIAFIHDHDDKDRKRALFQKVREGKVRILISTVKKLATGANIQTRLAAMHFLDPPWKPADIEQALGRAIRRGNLYKDWGGVQGFTYVTRGSFDAYIWQLLENKAKAIKQIMRGESDSVEDTGRIELNADEVKALASSNPKVLELVRVRNEAGQLRAEYYGHRQEIGNVQSEIAYRTGVIKRLEDDVIAAEAEIAKLPSRDDLHSDFTVTIGKKKYSKRSEIGAALAEALPVITETDKDKRQKLLDDLSQNPVLIGSAYGTKIYAGRSSFDGTARLVIQGYRLEMSENDTANGVKLFNYFDKKYDEPRTIKENIAKNKQQLEALKLRADQKWPKEERLKAAEQSLDQLEKELGSAAGDKNALPVVSALTKFAIMAEKLGRMESRPVTFDGTQWIHGDRMPVRAGAITQEMEREVDNEVSLMLSDSKEVPHESFFFRRKPVLPETEPERLRREADQAQQELRQIQAMNEQYNSVIAREWKRSTSATSLGSAPVFSKEMFAAVAGRALGSIRAGAKRFEVMIRELRAEHPEGLIVAMKPNLIAVWNSMRPKFGLEDVATDAAFDTAIAATGDADLQQATEAAIAASTPTPDPETPPAATPDPAPLEPDMVSEPGRTYSLKNAATDADRKELGMEPRTQNSGPKQDAQVAMAAALAKTDSGRKQVDDLIVELDAKPRATTPMEHFQLLQRYAETHQAYKNALAEKNAARRIGDDVSEAIAQREAELYLKQSKDIVRIDSGTVSYLLGSGLAARRVAIREDFSMETMVLEYESAYGRTLDSNDPADKAILDELEQQIADLEASNAELKKLLDERDATVDDLNTKLKEAHDAAVVAASEAPKVSAARKRAQQKVSDAWAGVMATLSSTKVNSQIVPYQDTFAAMIKLAEAYAGLGVTTLAEYLDRVRKRMGPAAEPLIPQFTDGWNEHQKKIAADDQELITGKIDPSDDDSIGRAARELHRMVIQRDGLDASAAGRNAAVVAVYEILADYVPGITEDQVARAMSGIGVFSELNKDEIEVIRRDQKAQLLLLQQIRDANRGELSPLTGRERDPRSDIQRELLRLKNQAIKDAGIITGGPGQLRSALDAAKRMARNRIADLDKALKKNDPIPRNKKILKDDGSPEFAELTALRERRDELQKLYDQAFGKRQLSDEQRLNAAEKALDRAIDNLEADLKAGKLYGDPAKPALTSPAIEAKRAALDAMKASRDELRLSSGQAQSRADAAAEANMDRAIANLERDLAAGKLYGDPKTPRALTPEMKKKQEQLDALKDRRDKLREDSGQAQARSDAAYERHLLEKDAELARRLAENDFKPKEKKPARVLTPSMLKVMHAIQKKEEALTKKRKAWEFENKHIVYRTWQKGPVQAMGMVRKGLTTLDQSLIGRQGWLLGITHPILYGKSIKKAFASNMIEAKSIFPTEQDVFNTEAELDADENWVRLEKIGKLAVTGVHGGLKKTEENYADVPEWFDRLWGVGGSERAGSAFINSQRRLVFRELVTQLAKMQGKGEASLSSVDLRVIGNAVNVASGRAALGEHENMIKGLTLLFFSPRWWASRLQTMIGAPIWWSEARWRGGEGASTEVRLLVAKEWGKQMIAQAVIMTLVVSALKAAFGDPGDDEEWDWYGDPKSPNFGRLRIGSTYIDMTAGIGAHVSMLARLITGKQVDRWETKDIDRWRMFTNYGRTKLAPMPGIAADWMDGQSIGQDPFGSTDWMLSKAVPLSIQDVYKTFKEESVPLSTVVSLMMFFGMGAQTREAKTKSRADIANEIRAMRKQGQSPEKIQKALTKHLEYTAKIEAREKLRTANPEEKAALESVVAGESSSAMASAVEKEKYDLTVRALEMLSSEDPTKKKAAGEDASITTARAILKEIAPTYQEAYAMFDRAYMAKHGPLTMIVGEKGKKRRVAKDGVIAARRRLKAIYQP